MLVSANYKADVMIQHNEITLPSSFIETIDSLDENVTVEEIEKKIIKQALSIFKAKWGSIKYYYGNQFVSGATTVPEEFRLTPRKRGYAFKTVRNDEPHLLTENILRKAHPEAHPQLKSMMLAPLRLDASTVASVTMFDTKDRKPSKRITKKLQDFGAIYGRILKMAHKFAAEKKAVTNRDKFMSFAAHELKNPLQAIAGYNYLIKNSIQKNNKIDPEWLDKTSDEVGRMKSLIDELLDIKQSQDGEFIFSQESVPLQQLLKEVCDNFKVRNPKRQLVIDDKLTGTDVLLGDSVKLNQLFINLLNNAHKFTDPEKSIFLEATKNDSGFQIIIKDEGMGIPIEEQAYIFKEFYRGSNGDKKKGIGIGLFLVKAIVDGHNGSIKVESQLGKGSTFTVYFPSHQ